MDGLRIQMQPRWWTRYAVRLFVLVAIRVEPRVPALAAWLLERGPEIVARYGFTYTARPR